MRTHPSTSNSKASMAVVGEGLQTAYPSRAEIVVPDDALTFPQPRTICVGTAGTVVVTPASSDTPDPVSVVVPAGGHVPFVVVRVWEASTALDMVSVW